MQGSNFHACLIVFGVQMTLIFAIFKTIVYDAENFKFITPNVPVYIVRFLCALLLHMELTGEVSQGIQMMSYLNCHCERFSSTWVPFLICLMQVTGGAISMFTNLFMLATRTSVEYCITFFVAFHVLTAVDNIYAEGLSNFHLKEAVEEPLVWARKSKDIAWKSRKCADKFILIVYRVLSFSYNMVYYYYLPFIVNVIPYFAPGVATAGAAHE